ncbi:MAG: GntR family transcriptional regulator [Chloroflexi bacterium]|nr:GntR family transcriptional regulator [Chloroflexota bacterium]
MCQIVDTVSRGIVREAIQTLIYYEGLIRREHGRGTFVNPSLPESTPLKNIPRKK